MRMHLGHSLIATGVALVVTGTWLMSASCRSTQSSATTDTSQTIDTGGDRPVTLRVRRASTFVDPPVVAARAAARSVIIEGMFMTPCAPCYRLRATAHQAATHARIATPLTVDLTATSESRATLGMVGQWEYAATIDSLRPGQYELIVRHTTRETYDSSAARQQVVLRTLVVVR